MTFEIHFTLKDGSEDFVVISGDTISEIQEIAVREVEKRGGSDPWSKEL